MWLQSDNTFFIAQEGSNAAQIADGLAKMDKVTVCILYGSILSKEFHLVVGAGILSYVRHLDVSSARLCVEDMVSLMEALRGADYLQTLFTHGNAVGTRWLKALACGLGELGTTDVPSSLHTLSLSGSITETDLNSKSISKPFLKSVERLPWLSRVLLCDISGSRIKQELHLVTVVNKALPGKVSRQRCAWVSIGKRLSHITECAWAG